MRRLWIITLVCLGLFPLSAGSQIFHVGNTDIYLNNTTDNDPLHWYNNIYNDTTVDLSMRWRASLSLIPPSWTITIHDIYNNTVDLAVADSGDYILEVQPPVQPMLIINIFSNGSVGNGTVTVTTFPVDYPWQQATFYFHLNIEAGTMQTVTLQSASLVHEAYLQRFLLPAAGVYQVISMNGQVLQAGKGTVVNYGSLPRGVYALVVQCEGRNFYTRFTVI